MTTENMMAGKSLQLASPAVPGRDLTAYIASVNSVPVLTAEEELNLAKQYYYEDNLEAARHLVMACLLYTSPSPRDRG